MLNLFRMDIIFWGKRPIYNLIFCLFIVFAFIHNLPSQVMYLILITMTATCMCSLNISREYVNGPACMINSLPITRKEIVISRYIGIVIYVFVICLAFVFIGVLFKILKLPFNIEDLRMSTVIIGAFYVIFVECLCYPFAFKLNFKKGQLIIDLLNSAALMIMIFFFVANSEEAIYRINKFVGENSLLIQGVAIVSIILMITISLLLSLKFYENKDL